ncbi:hypothetical protein H310_12134 [Aphanomyces invadans]|uniref:Methyltransferase type 11 domain-containing protein n=1 Tax=Aphanomyces invadans TaxID=157072 RepID=A0A024TIY0_9STRA|nr:hypothetical protein H310_12134 [Aphanomyces invadans]ETV94125.1 hypothetical protein H310_12134 [Aphanomyces invadans]|eukprot:XP_008877328.1 hypothetical protein H310_12134 [Aphanomyces invadans]
MSKRPTVPDFGSVEYWDNRYIEAGARARMEWLFPYKDVQGSFESYLGPDKSAVRVLVLGCGTSTLADDLRQAGFHHVTCIDFSGAAIRCMTSASSPPAVSSTQPPPIQYIQMDVRDLTAFADNSFDVVIDKGVLDCVVCGISNSVGATRMLSEVRRVLQAPSGVFFLFSTGSYATRVPYIEEASSPPAWHITPVVLGQPSHVLALMLRPADGHPRGTLAVPFTTQAKT